MKYFFISILQREERGLPCLAQRQLCIWKLFRGAEQGARSSSQDIIFISNRFLALRITSHCFKLLCTELFLNIQKRGCTFSSGVVRVGVLVSEICIIRLVFRCESKSSHGHWKSFMSYIYDINNMNIWINQKSESIWANETILSLKAFLVLLK